MPLAVPVRDPDGNDMDMVLTGILDLVLMDTATMTNFRTGYWRTPRAQTSQLILLHKRF